MRLKSQVSDNTDVRNCFRVNSEHGHDPKNDTVGFMNEKQVIFTTGAVGI